MSDNRGSTVSPFGDFFSFPDIFQLLMWDSKVTSTSSHCYNPVLYFHTKVKALNISYSTKVGVVAALNHQRKKLTFVEEVHE